MQVDSLEKIRNLAVAGHNDTGKTTLISALLHAAGVTDRLQRVEDGSTVTDFDPEEISRQISIGLGVCHVPWRQHKLNLIDCPGYGIFFPETKSGMRAADAVLLSVNAISGVEVTTESVWEYAEELGMPVILTLTKMDRERAELERNLEALQNSFAREVLPIQIPLGSEASFEGVVDLVEGKALRFDADGDGRASEVEVPEELGDQVEEWRTRLVEGVAESDEELLERYLEEGDLSRDELRAGLRKAVSRRQLFPLTLTCGVHNVGSSALLDVLVDVAPSPADVEALPGHDLGGEPVELSADPQGPMATLVFKTLNDPFTGKLSLLRVVSGTLMADTPAWNASREEAEKVGHLMVIQGKTGSEVPQLIAGDIGAVGKLKLAQTGDTLCAKGTPLAIDWIEVPEPAISFAVEPKSKGDEEKIGDALGRLMEEDISLRASRDPDTAEFLISGTGQLHVEIAVEKLKQRFHVEVILHPPKVPYRETILRPAEGHGRHKKQTGGRGQFADCRIRLEPLERGSEFEFVDEIFGGAIPQQFRGAVQKGIEEARQRGFVAGHKVVDFRVRLQDGQYHDVDSSEMAFKIAGSLAFKDAMKNASPTLLEPLMKVVISTTDEFMGDIMSDLSSRRGRPQGMESKGHTQVVTAVVPMAEMLNYAPALRSMTQGRASFQIQFSHYEEVPRQVQEKLIAAAQAEQAG